LSVAIRDTELDQGRRKSANAALRSAISLVHRPRQNRNPGALYPIISQMERAAGLAREDTSQAKLDKLDGLLKQTSTSAQDAALFAEMLSLPNDGRYHAVELTPQQHRQRTLEALDLQVEALARCCPVLMVFEDAHWSDPISLELFGRAVDRPRTLSVLLIVTFRPEFEPLFSC
jgi:predicted ATPase